MRTIILFWLIWHNIIPTNHSKVIWVLCRSSKKPKKEQYLLERNVKVNSFNLKLHFTILQKLYLPFHTKHLHLIYNGFGLQLKLLQCYWITLCHENFQMFSEFRRFPNEPRHKLLYKSLRFRTLVMMYRGTCLTQWLYMIILQWSLDVVDFPIFLTSLLSHRWRPDIIPIISCQIP